MFLSLVSVAEAASNAPGVAEAQAFVAKVNEIILFPFIMLLMAVALFMFLFGCYEYLTHSNESEARETGKMHMLWGIVGMFIMLVAYGILSIAAGTFGLNDELDCANNPLEAGCEEVFRLPTNFDPSSGTPGSNIDPSSGTPGSNIDPSSGTPGSNIDP